MKTKSHNKLQLNLRLLIYGALLLMAVVVIPTTATAQVPNAVKTETAPPPPPPVPGTMEGDAYLSVDIFFQNVSTNFHPRYDLSSRVLDDHKVSESHS